MGRILLSKKEITYRVPCWERRSEIPKVLIVIIITFAPIRVPNLFLLYFGESLLLVEAFAELLGPVFLGPILYI